VRHNIFVQSSDKLDSLIFFFFRPWPPQKRNDNCSKREMTTAPIDGGTIISYRVVHARANDSETSHFSNSSQCPCPSRSRSFFCSLSLFHDSEYKITYTNQNYFNTKKKIFIFHLFFQLLSHIIIGFLLDPEKSLFIISWHLEVVHPPYPFSASLGSTLFLRRHHDCHGKRLQYRHVRCCR
jgi:hypothetical protein